MKTQGLEVLIFKLQKKCKKNNGRSKCMLVPIFGPSKGLLIMTITYYFNWFFVEIFSFVFWFLGLITQGAHVITLGFEGLKQRKYN